MQVPFYGHVRQYHNLQAEIDGAIHAVLESGEYVMGPTLARFEKELAAYAGMKHAIGRQLRHRRHLAGAHGAGHRPGRRGHHHRQHLLRHRRGDLDRRRHGRVRGHRAGHLPA